MNTKYKNYHETAVTLMQGRQANFALLRGGAINFKKQCDEWALFLQSSEIDRESFTAVLDNSKTSLMRKYTSGLT